MWNTLGFSLYRGFSSCSTSVALKVNSPLGLAFVLCALASLYSVIRLLSRFYLIFEPISRWFFSNCRFCFSSLRSSFWLPSPLVSMNSCVRSCSSYESRSFFSFFFCTTVFVRVAPPNTPSSDLKVALPPKKEPSTLPEAVSAAVEREARSL